MTAVTLHEEIHTTQGVRQVPDFERIFAAYQPRLKWLALRILGDEEDARDAVQEAFVRLHQSNGSLDRTKSLSAYLSQTTVNVCLDELRRRRTRPQTCSLETTWGPDGPPDDAGDPLSITLARAQRDRINQVLVRLPTVYREVLVLRSVAGLSYEELAQAQACPIGTVRSRLARGRLRFRRLWDRKAESETTSTSGTSRSRGCGSLHGT